MLAMWLVCLLKDFHITLYGRIDGSWPRGRPRKKWLDNVKEDCAPMNLNLAEATRLVKDSRCWRKSVRHLECRRERTSSSSQRQ